MNQEQKMQPATNEIDLRTLLNVVWQGKLAIILTTLVFTFAAVVYSVMMPDVYKSEALLAPASTEKGVNLPGQIGGLAALAGVNLGSLGSDNKTGLAIEIIQSREFIGRFIDANDLYVPIMAAKGWSRSDDSLVIDQDIYDDNQNNWVRKIKVPFKAKPSQLEVYEKFIKLMSITEDKKTGMVRLSVEYYSPFLAKKWVDNLVKAINEEMKNRDLAEALRSIDYLKKQIELTNISDVKTMFYSLIEEQTKTVMLANVRNEYVFQTIDPAVIAEKKAKPQRLLIIIFIAIISFFLSVSVIVMKFIFKD
jgi:uncharacterized protein involved in exopolysaccharide biosynthesis